MRNHLIAYDDTVNLTLFMNNIMVNENTISYFYKLMIFVNFD